MKEFIEIISQIAGILSLVVAIIALIFIKPISNYFSKSSSNNLQENNNWNTFNIWWDYINTKVVSTNNLSSNNENNGK